MHEIIRTVRVKGTYPRRGEGLNRWAADKITGWQPFGERQMDAVLARPTSTHSGVVPYYPSGRHFSVVDSRRSPARVDRRQVRVGGGPAGQEAQMYELDGRSSVTAATGGHRSAPWMGWIGEMRSGSTHA